jgi:hypothetical protein
LRKSTNFISFNFISFESDLKATRAVPSPSVPEQPASHPST